MFQLFMKSLLVDIFIVVTSFYDRNLTEWMVFFLSSLLSMLKFIKIAWLNSLQYGATLFLLTYFKRLFGCCTLWLLYCLIVFGNVLLHATKRDSFFQTDSYSNPPPGTVVDDTVTRKNFFNFFLVSQKCNEVSHSQKLLNVFSLYNWKTFWN